MKIAHIADIHIRLSSRHDEYVTVFKRLFSSLKKHLTSEDAIIIAGDIVHSKTDLTPELILLVNYFFESLGKIAPTYVLLGNHDLNVKNTAKLDSITPIFKIREGIPSVQLIQESRTVKLQDGVFTDFYHINDESTTGMFSSVDQSACHIAVAHGMLVGAKTKDGFIFTQGEYNMKQFSNYDIVMLGDIHSRQDIGKSTIAYSGSLIQQNFGEEIEKGYLLWDTDILSKEFVPVKNDWVYYTLKVKDGDALPSLPVKPKYLNLRVLWQMNSTDISATKFETFQEEIRKKYSPHTLTVISIPNDSLITSTGEFKHENLSEFVNNALISIGKEEGLSEDETSQLLAYNKKLDGETEPYQTMDKVWSPKMLEFDNLFSYGKGNTIDFNTSGITGVFADNAAGKSALMESFLYSVYGEVSRTKNIREIIRKGTAFCSATVYLELDGRTYRIKRKAKLINVKLKMTSGPKVERATGSVDFDVMENGEWVALNGIDKKETDKIIEGYFGSVRDFLLTSFSAQGDITSFIDTQATERKDVLIRFLGLDFLEDKFKLAKEELASINWQLSMIEKQGLEEKEVDSLKNSLSELTASYNEQFANKTLLRKKLKENHEKSLRLATKLKPEYDWPVDSLKCASEKLHTTQGNIEHFIKEVEELESTVSTSVRESDVIQTKLNGIPFELVLKEIEDESNLASRVTKTKLEIKAAKDIVNVLREKQKGFSFSEGVCDACPLYQKTKENTETLKKKEREISEKTAALYDLEKQLSIHDVTSLEATVDRYNSLNKELSTTLMRIVSLKSDLAVANKNLNDSISERDSLTKYIEDYTANVKAIEGNQKLDTKIASLLKKTAALQEELDALDASLTSITVSINQITDKLSTFEDNLKLKSTLDKNHRIVSTYIKAVHRDGIPYQAILNSLPSINMEVNNILSGIVDFSVFITPDVTDKKALQVYLSYEDGKERLIDVASGMEKMLTSLALRAALIKISRLPKPTIWIIDEGFGSLDKNNLQAMRHMFHKIKGMFENIFIISHVGDLKDLSDHELHITKKHGISKVG